MPEIAIDDVARRYGRRWALAHITLQVASGASWMLLGHNGSGKSTLLRCLATAQRIHAGQIRYGGRDLWTHRSELRRQIGVLGHATALYEDLSGYENLAVWADLGGHRADLGALLERVGLDPARRDPMRTFSAGMRRRLALARLLLKTPELVLLDEPFTALDAAGRELMLDVIRDLRARGATLIIATHLPRIAKAVTDHALILDGGKMAYSGTVDGLPADLAFE